MLSIVHIQLANSGGGVEDDGLNFRITSCGISLSFGSCRLYRNFATAILFQMINPIVTPISNASISSGIKRLNVTSTTLVEPSLKMRVHSF